MLEARLSVSMLVTKLATGSSMLDKIPLFCHPLFFVIPAELVPAKAGSGNPEAL